MYTCTCHGSSPLKLQTFWARALLKILGYHFKAQVVTKILKLGRNTFATLSYFGGFLLMELLEKKKKRSEIQQRRWLFSQEKSCCVVPRSSVCDMILLRTWNLQLWRRCSSQEWWWVRTDLFPVSPGVQLCLPWSGSTSLDAVGFPWRPDCLLWSVFQKAGGRLQAVLVLMCQVQMWLQCNQKHKPLPSLCLPLFPLVGTNSSDRAQ